MADRGIDETLLRKCIELARAAAERGERPIAALLARSGEMVAEAQDAVFGQQDPTAHAERVLISGYCSAHSLLHLRGYTLYSAVEPCMMCCGAIHWAKLDRVVYGLSQKRLRMLSGGSEKPSIHDFLPAGRHPVEIAGPLLEEEAFEVARLYPWVEKRVSCRETEDRSC